MTPYELLGWCIVAVIVAAVVPYIIGKNALARKARTLSDAAAGNAHHFGDVRYSDSAFPGYTARFDNIGDEPENAVLRAARERFRSEEDAVQRYLRESATVDVDAVKNAATQAVRRQGWPGGTITGGRPPARSVGKNPALGSPYRNERGEAVDGRGIRTRSIFLSPAQLAQVNAARRAAGRPTLNRAGMTSAVAHAWDQPVRQPDTASNWLTYLILYDCFSADHQGSTHIGMTITPDAPYNGHGGEFAGAGASGDWSSPDASTAAAVAAMAPVAITEHRVGDAVPAGGLYDALSDPQSFKGSSDFDPAQNVQAPADPPGGSDSAPQASQNDSAPSYSAPSNDSALSDSGSSGGGGGGGGGGDSGGGGGGGDGS